MFCKYAESDALPETERKRRWQVLSETDYKYLDSIHELVKRLLAYLNITVAEM